MFKQFKKIFIFTLIMFFYSINCVYALNVTDEGKTGGNVSSNEGSNRCKDKSSCFHYCGSGQVAVSFRFTMVSVDKNGKVSIVPGTHSVDIASSNKCGGQTLQNYYGINEYHSVNGKINYKYGVNTDNGTFEEIAYLPNSFGYSSASSVKQFKESLSNFDNMVVNYDSMNFMINGNPVSFVDWFLHKCGYLSDSSSARIVNNDDKWLEIVNGDYFIIYEPAIFMFYRQNGNEFEYYDTISAFADYMYNNPASRLALNASNLREWFGDISTTKVGTFKQITSTPKNSSCESIKQNTKNTNLSWAQRHTYFLHNEGFGCGVHAFSLSDIPIGRDEENVNKEINFDLKLCQSNDSDTDGIISFSSSKDEKNMLDNDLFKVGEDDGLYCYDDVFYNFSDFIDNLSVKIKDGNDFNIDSAGTLDVYRKCSIKSSFIDEGRMTNFNSYMNKKIKLSVGSKEYIFSVKNVKISPLSNSKSTKEYQFTLKYVIKDKITLDSSSSNVQSKIVFDDVSSMFGYSNNFINNMYKSGSDKILTRNFSKSNGSTTYNYNFKYTLSASDGAEEINSGNINGYNLSCGFNVDIPVTNKFKEIVFRTISLDNPFPARDGTSRLPGLNWLNDDENFVSEYINPDIYNKEPIYSITLDYSTILKIRGYNKEHSYSDIKLNCNPNTWRECLSDFLRNSDMISASNFDGKCSKGYTRALDSQTALNISSCSTQFLTQSTDCYEKKYDYDRNGIINTYDANLAKVEADINIQQNIGIIENELVKNIKACSGDDECYNKSFDLNQDNIVDAIDVKIANLSGSDFYYCAHNKTQLSGGPVQDINIDEIDEGENASSSD